MSDQEHKRLNQRAQRFADGNKSFKKKLSVADLIQSAVRHLLIHSSIR